jgi:Cd2+/Zn2+-exporting ATPase
MKEASPGQEESDPAAETLQRVVNDTSGIVSARLDGPRRAVVIEYDGAAASPADIERIARDIQPAALAHFDKCLLRLQGRACEGCALKLERRARRVPGVHRATATFLGGVMSITYDHHQLAPEHVVDRLRAIGAPVRPYREEAPRPAWFTGRHVEAVLTVATLVFMIAGWVAGRVDRPAWPLYLAAYLAGGWFGVLSSLRSLRQWTIDVDLLMVLAALGAAYVGAPFEGALLLFLFSLSNVLQGYAIQRTRQAISSLMKLRPEKALVRRGDQMEWIPIESLQVGDLVIVRPGESIPLDGLIVEGASEIDQSSLTGESMPVSRAAGDPVFAATLNQTGALEVRVTRCARDSTIARLIRLVEEAQSEKADSQRFLERAEQYYALGVILFTLGLIAVPLALGADSFERVFYRAMTVMVVASPCALIISTPASILSAIGGGARRGVLFKGGVYLEKMAAVRFVAFDKTGTLTRGEPQVTDILLPDGHMQSTDRLDEAGRRLLGLAASVEARSEHLIGQAMLRACRALNIPLDECGEFRSVTGKGITAMVGGRRVAVGNLRHFEEYPEIPRAWGPAIQRLQEAGKTPVLVVELAGRANLLGIIALADAPRDDAAAVVRRLRAMPGIERVVLLTGDHYDVAAAIAKQVGVDEFHAGLLPDDKVAVVRELRKRGPVAMVGDGINDAPALAAATVGIAMGAAGTDVAMETADVVLMSNHLDNIPRAIDLSRRARRIVIQNLVFALVVIVGLVIAALGFHLPLPLGVVGHEGSTVLVCLNGLRLLRG